MSEEFRDEVVSINSIYGGDTLSPQSGEPGIYVLALPVLPSVSLRLAFSPDYPSVPPSVLGTQHVGNELAKGAGNTIVEMVRNILSEVYAPGTPCLFDIIEESSQRFHQLSCGRCPSEQEHQIPHTNSWVSRHARQDDMISSDDYQSLDNPDDTPPWALSEPMTEKKSVFVARAAKVSSVEEAKSFLAHLLATDKKVAKATHNITAWRIRREDGVQYQDCDDDGEDAAGGRLLHLLELMNVWGCMVVVSRWYGGVKLGPDRFRIVNQCAREAIIKGSLVEEEREGGPKKKGKK